MRMTLMMTGLLALCVAAPLAAKTLPAMRTLEPMPGLPTPPPGSTLRVEADLAGRAAGWHGVRHCERLSRARASLRPAFYQWLGEQVAAHSGRRVLRHGWNNASYTVSSGQRPWPDNSRWCRGRLTRARAYVEFH